MSDQNDHNLADFFFTKNLRKDEKLAKRDHQRRKNGSTRHLWTFEDILKN